MPVLPVDIKLFTCFRLYK